MTFKRFIRTINRTISGIKMSVFEFQLFKIVRYPIPRKGSDTCKRHKILGYYGSERLEKTEKIHDLKLRSNLRFYVECAIARAKQERI
jgi:hypothetical protein